MPHIPLAYKAVSRLQALGCACMARKGQQHASECLHRRPSRVEWSAISLTPDCLWSAPFGLQ